MSGEWVTASFFWPYDKLDEPYIRVATGDFQELISDTDKYDTLAGILASITHELTHYFQWANSFEQTPRGEEWQATYYGGQLVCLYLSQHSLI